MSYTPTVWNDGDVITKDKLNKLEQGVKNEQVGPQGPAGPTQAATKSQMGAVKQAALVADATGENVTKDEFNALLAALKAAGIMATS